MLDSRKTFERILQSYRFKKARKFLNGDILDFGGNKGELERYVKGDYTVVNYDYSTMYNKLYDTILLLAVLEHIEVREVLQLFMKFKDCLKTDGKIFLTTPAPASRPVLEILAFLGILDKKNIEEHKHYWNRNELFTLAQDTNYEVVIYKKFQLGFNQYLLLKHRNN